MIKPICTGRSLGDVVPTRGVLGTDTIEFVIDIGRSAEVPLERSMLKRFVPARPNDESSGAGNSTLSRSGIEWNEVSIVAEDGDRGRLAPNSPRSADTATEGGLLSGGEAERREGAGDIVPAVEND